jgi:hypothetical protein
MTTREESKHVEQRIYNRAVELRQEAEGTPKGHPFKMTGAHRGFLEQAAREITGETGHKFRLGEDHGRPIVVLATSDPEPTEGGGGAKPPRAGENAPRGKTPGKDKRPAKKSSRAKK